MHILPNGGIVKGHGLDGWVLSDAHYLLEAAPHIDSFGKGLCL